VDKTARDDDLHLLDRWKTTQDPKYYQQLYMNMKPEIEKAMKGASYGSNLPQAAHKAWAAQSFYEALRTYDPSRGELRTHIHGAVKQKQKRLNYRFGNLGYRPEPRATKVGLFQNENENLKNELGRDPSTGELATRLDMTHKDVLLMQKEMIKDLAMAEGTEEKVTFENPREEEVMRMLYFDINPEEQKVYDYIFGQHGRQRMVKPNGKVDYDGIARQVGFSSSKVRIVTKAISTKLKKAVER
jgi:DNA-directed RNA polymerase specialized sigma subunit